jgi:hypothetical protein
MENISNTDFDRLEKLLRSKQFQSLNAAERQFVIKLISAEEYSQMAALYQSANHSTDEPEIEPLTVTKTKLDKVFGAKRQSLNIFRMRMPVYQSAVAAVVFFVVGFGVNYSNPAQTRILHSTTQVIKYVDRPVNEIKYITVTAKVSKKNTTLLQAVNAPPLVETASGNDMMLPESNPEVLRQQEIAMTNITRVLNEKNGTSMGNDTLLQKMMVTVY